MLFNTNLIILIFRIACLQEFDVDYLLSLDGNLMDIYVNPPYLAGYIATENLTDFLLNSDIKFTNIHKCMTEFSYDLLFQVGEVCNLETTNTIFYPGSNVSKPNAWDLDFFATPLDFKYVYPSLNENIELWVLDTGINWKHLEFEGIQVEDVDPLFTIKNITHAHGTGTAACAGGKNYGASKIKTIYNYPVCRSGGSCAGSDIDRGLHLILSRLQTFNPRCNTSTFHNTSTCVWNKRVVINLSVGSNGGINLKNTSLGLYFNQLFKDINDYGGIIVNSAGNSNEDACAWFYSFSDNVISVGSIDQNQNNPFTIAKSSFSNWGACVDIWNYGSSVPTAYSVTDNTTIQYKSGTSFSSPLTAGLTINILSQKPNANRYEILQYLTFPIQNFTVAKYNCYNITKRCCTSKIKNTRQNKYCIGLGINECNLIRDCKIEVC